MCLLVGLRSLPTKDMLQSFASSMTNHSCHGKRKMTSVTEELCRKVAMVQQEDRQAIEWLHNFVEKIPRRTAKVAEKGISINEFAEFMGTSIHNSKREASGEWEEDWEVPVVGDVLDLLQDLTKSDPDKKDILIIALRVTKVVCNIASMVLPFPGAAYLADKLLGYAITSLAAEAEESLDGRIDQIATESVQRALMAQKLREAQHMVQSVNDQIAFHDSLDAGWAGVMEDVEMELPWWSSNKNILVLLRSATSFSRWLVIENALSTAIAQLLPPERADAHEKGQQGEVQPVEERARFRVVLVEHFVLYTLVLQRMSTLSSHPKLRQKLVKRAQAMALKAFPVLAVMFEKQWDNRWFRQFLTSQFCECDSTSITHCRCDKAQALEIQKTGESFEREQREKYGSVYDCKSMSWKPLFDNVLLYPAGTQRPSWCRSQELECDPDFVVKCLWLPLYGSQESWPRGEYVHAQQLHELARESKSKRAFFNRAAQYHHETHGVLWTFGKTNVFNRRQELVHVVRTECRPLYLGCTKVYKAEEVTEKEGSVVTCPNSMPISRLVLVHPPGHSPRVARSCLEADDALQLQEDTLFAYGHLDALAKDTPTFWQGLCARDYAFLVKVVFEKTPKGWLMKSFCRYGVWLK